MTLPEEYAHLDAFLMLISFVVGTLVGSFANVCVSRWPAGESVVSPRSRCPKCQNAIAWYDNIPIFSWLVLGAKCRHCGQPISWQYPLVEAITGILFLLVYLQFGLTLATPVYMGFCAAMVIVTFQDLADWTIPDEISMPGIFIGIGLAVVGMMLPASGLLVTQPLDAVLGAALGAGIILLLDRVTVVLLKKQGMGFGDVKLLGMIGAFTGWKGALLTLIGGAYLGTIVGVPMLVYFKYFAKDSGQPLSKEEEKAKLAQEEADGKGKPEEEEGEGVSLRGHYLPFGPYLAIAGVLYVFFGPQAIDWYLALMNTPPTPPGAGL